MNKVIMIGNLTKDPELTTTPNGISVCKMSIAVNRRFGENEADFFNIVVWRQLAENCANYLSKGKKIAVSGILQNRQWETQTGEKRYVTEIIADDIQFLSPKDGNAGVDPDAIPKTAPSLRNSENFIGKSAKKEPKMMVVDSDDLPF